MKKYLISLCALALPALATAQVQLMSGYNFGQFIGAGVPALDGATGDAVGSIGSNFRLTTQAPNSSSGDFVGNNGTTGNYSNGFGRVYWDGTNGSSSYNFSGGVQIVATDVGLNSVNGQTVQGYSLGFQGDGLNLALTSTVSSNRIAFVQNTSGFADFDPTAFTNGAGVTSDANLTFAATASAGTNTITWFLNGSGTSFATTTLSGAGTMTSYSVDLPAEFYGLSGAQLVAQFSGTTTLDNVQFNGVSAIPEPSTYAAILGAAALGFVVIRRRQKAAVVA